MEQEIKELRDKIERDKFVIDELEKDYATAERRRKKWKRRWKLQQKAILILLAFLDAEKLEKAMDLLNGDGDCDGNDGVG